MSGEENRDFKSEGFTSKTSISLRHREKTENGIRKNRDKIIKRHRYAQQEPINDVAKAIHAIFSLPFLSDAQLQSLSSLMSNAKNVLEPYFAPSPLYPEFSAGPFLFSDPSILAKIVQKFANGQVCAGYILINVSAAQETSTWISRLIQSGIVPVVLQMINNPVASGDNRSSAFWIIANMCIDNDNTRNALIAEPLLLSGMRMQTDPVLVQDVYYLWNFLMANPPFPMPEHIQVIWNSLPYTQDESNLTLLRRGVMRLVKSSALYQEWAFRNPDVMRVMSNVAAFYGCLIKHNELRDITLQQGMLDTLCNFLNDFNIENRIWALLALTNLTKHVPNQILAHRFIIERVIEMIRVVDENRVQRELYYFIIHLLANSETARIMLIEKDVMRVFASLFESVIMREDVPLMHDGMGVLLDLFHAYPHCMQRFEELGGRESVEMFEFSDSQDLLLRADKICTLLGAPPK